MVGLRIKAVDQRVRRRCRCAALPIRRSGLPSATARSVDFGAQTPRDRPRPWACPPLLSAAPGGLRGGGVQFLGAIGGSTPIDSRGRAQSWSGCAAVRPLRSVGMPSHDQGTEDHSRQWLGCSSGRARANVRALLRKRPSFFASEPYRMLRSRRITTKLGELFRRSLTL